MKQRLKMMMTLLALSIVFVMFGAAQAATFTVNNTGDNRANSDLSSVFSLNGFAADSALRGVFSAFADPMQSGGSVTVNAAASAATFTVDTTADDASLTACTAAPNDCSLRGAINNANASAGADTIDFDPTVFSTAQTITKSSSIYQPFVVNSDLIINGPGASLLTIKSSAPGNGTYVGEIFDISGGVVAVNNLKLSGGYASKTCYDYGSNINIDCGGAVYMSGGTVTFSGITISDSSARQGGGIYTRGGSLNVSGSTISNNNAGAYGSGGGIYTDGSASVTITNSTISGNIAGVGAGIRSGGGTLNITNSTISGNTAKNYLQQNSFYCNYPACPNPPPDGYTCSGVTCTGYDSHNGLGAGIFNAGATVNVTNSTISGNTAQGYDTLVGHYGGGIENWSNLTIANSTITNNFGSYGGGILNRGTLNLSNSIVAGNRASHDAPDTFNYPNSTTSGNYNLVQNGDAVTGTGNITGQDAKLGALANNGGATRTHALLEGSPAIDAGDPNFNTTNTPFDQRGIGFDRKVGSAIDIGAYEASPFIVNTLADHDDGACGTGDCTLREAVKYAAAAGATVTFGVSGTITLTQGEIVLVKNISINGPTTAPGITISGNNQSRIFSVGSTFGSDTLNLSNLTLTKGNGVGTTGSGNGGAIYSSGTVNVSNCTFTANAANRITANGVTTPGNGGAIRSSSTLTVANSTFSGNTAAGSGGAILFANSATITSSTISGNTAVIGGGGINNNSQATSQNPVILSNNIIAGNSAPTGPDFNGKVTGGDYNLIQNTSGATLSGTHNITGQDPKLDTLKDNGGPTATMALLSGSPAIDAGNPSFDTTNTPYDQRGSGYARKGGSAIDIGAFEVQAQDSTTTATAINYQPQNQSVCESASANFSVVASGTTLTYQWRKGGVNLTDDSTIFGATSANLMINSATANSAGSYDVVVSGANGTQTSVAATLTVNSAPAITSQPADKSVNPGADASFTAAASGAQTVQWQVSTDGGANFSDIGGATAGTLTLSAVASSQNGSKYRAVFTGACGNPATSSAATLTVGKLAQTITFNAITDKTYGDAPFALSASSTSNLPVSFSVVSGPATISGSTLTITGAGSVTVKAMQSGNTEYNAAPSVERTFSVGKAQATITLSSLSQTYDGTAKAAAANTTPAGLNITLAYSQNGTPITSPTNAGSYIVAASVNEANYQGGASDTFTINKAGSSTTVTVGNAAYDGNSHGGSAAVTGAGGLNQGLTVTYAGRNGTVYPASTTAPTNAGDYSAGASFAGDANYASSSDSKDFTVAKAAATLSLVAADLNQTYTGSARSVGYTISPVGLSGVSVAYTGKNSTVYSSSTTAPTNGGSYDVVASLTNDNYQAANAVGTLVVGKANQTITFSALAAKTFGDADFTLSASSDSGLAVGFAAAGNCSVNGNTIRITGAGSCEITASQAGNDNYGAATSVARSFTVNQATQTISFGVLSNKFIGNGGISVSATGGNSGNPVTFASSTTSVCTSGGTNGATITFVGLGTCTITASQAGSGNYGAATGVSQSFQVNADPTTVTLDTSRHSFINFDCATDVISATVKDSVTGAWIQGATVNFVIGSQTVSATTDANGKASIAIVLNQQPGSVTVSASYAGSGNGYNLAGSAGITETIGASTNVGPGQNASSLYTGSLYYWTSSSTSSTATLTLSATLKDTLANCLGDITKAKVSFQISTNGGSSFSPVSGAQNLPVGLVNPTDKSVGTASAVSQYNIGNNQSVTLTVRVVVSGQYSLNTTQYDQLITIGKPGQANSLMGGGQVSNDKNPFPANGYLGLNSVNSNFGSQVTYNKSGTNPQGQVQIYIRSCNNSDGTLDANCDAGKPETHHVYFIKSNSISELSTINGSASFGSKTNVSEVLANGTKVGLDGGGTMQIVFTPFGKTIPKDMYVGSGSICSNQQGCMSVTAYKSSGGVWYSSSWGQSAGTNAPHTYVKNVLPGGAIAVQ